MGLVVREGYSLWSNTCRNCFEDIKQSKGNAKKDFLAFFDMWRNESNALRTWAAAYQHWIANDALEAFGHKPIELNRLFTNINVQLLEMGEVYPSEQEIAGPTRELWLSSTILERGQALEIFLRSGQSLNMRLGENKDKWFRDFGQLPASGEK